MTEVVMELFGALAYCVVSAALVGVSIWWLFDEHDWRGKEILNLYWLVRGVAKTLLYLVVVLAGALYRAVKQLNKDTAASEAIKNL